MIGLKVTAILLDLHWLHHFHDRSSMGLDSIALKRTNIYLNSTFLFEILAYFGVSGRNMLYQNLIEQTGCSRIKQTFTLKAFLPFNIRFREAIQKNESSSMLKPTGGGRGSALKPPSGFSSVPQTPLFGFRTPQNKLCVNFLLYISVAIQLI